MGICRLPCRLDHGIRGTWGLPRVKTHGDCGRMRDWMSAPSVVDGDGRRKYLKSNN